jgi:hypothetical protein
MIPELLSASPRELAARLRAGHPIDPARLDGADYDGVSLGLPGWVDRLLWKKFRKSFRDGRGFNVRIEQTPLDQPWVPQVRGGRPVTFGAFAVVSGAGRLELDYSVGEPLLRALRDPLVALVPGEVDWLLGRSYLAVGRRRLPTPSYFLLRRSIASPSRC